MQSPSSTISEGAVALSSASSSGDSRFLGKGTSEYSHESAIRPARSWFFTRW